jgi:hypothetical protein
VPGSAWISSYAVAAMSSAPPRSGTSLNSSKAADR